MLTTLQVRQPYLIELMAAKDTLLAQHMDHAKQTSDLHAAYQREGATVPVPARQIDTVTPLKVLTGTLEGDKAYELLVF